MTTQRMELRERAAIAAMQAIISNEQLRERVIQEYAPTDVAADALEYANALVDALYPQADTGQQQAPDYLQETPIDGIYTLRGKQYVCKAANGRDCNQCALFDEEANECMREAAWCAGEYRQDKTDVIFEHVTNN